MAIDYEKEALMDASRFVMLADFVPGIIQEIRYYSTYNFVGDRIDGYEIPCALMTKDAARALKAVSNKAAVMGYRLKVFDAYRPARRMKPFFYPDLEKQEIFQKGYVASQSTHSRGSTVDLTLLDMKSGKELDMGSPFDYFSEMSHPDCKDVTEEQFANRMLLRDLMVKNGFSPIDCEWWHFTLQDEPFPDTYFEFPVSMDALARIG